MREPLPYCKRIYNIINCKTIISIYLIKNIIIKNILRRITLWVCIDHCNTLVQVKRRIRSNVT